MDDLTAFLEARLAEDENEARSADHARLLRMSQRGDTIIVDAGFIQTFTPDRILAEIDAKRKIIDLHSRMWVRPNSEYFNDAHLTKEPMPLCSSCEPERSFRRANSFPCRTLKTLALPYADHPDYRKEEWAP